LHVSPSADEKLQEIYKTISQSYHHRPDDGSGDDSAGELQRELELLKKTLTASRRATTLQFLCFRGPPKRKQEHDTDVVPS
jgi:exocyst complex component 2